MHLLEKVSFFWRTRSLSVFLFSVPLHMLGLGSLFDERMVPRFDEIEHFIAYMFLLKSVIRNPKQS